MTVPQDLIERRKADPYLIKGPALISFSGGRTSGYMLKHTIDAHGGALPDNVKVAFANTGREMPQTLDFVQECSDRWGVHIIWLEYDPEADCKTRIVNHNSASRNGEPLEALIASKGILPNPLMRYCTIETKIRRFRELCVRQFKWDHWDNIIGLRADEMRRVEKALTRNEVGKDRWRAVMPLADAGVSKRDVQAWWQKQPFDLRLPNVNGVTPAGNCDLCFLKSEATILGLVRMNPALAGWWVRQEQQAATRLAGTQGNPDMALFRADRDSYAQMLDRTDRQGDMFQDSDGESVDCACTD